MFLWSIPFNKRWAKGVILQNCVTLIMESVESLEAFYKRKFDWLPDDIRSGIGHFNVFNLEPFVGKNAQPVPYKRRDFYKIMLVIGGGKVHYADEVIRVPEMALSFSNPHIPYKWEHTEIIREGVFCIFDRHFFQGFGELEKYSVFQPQGDHIFQLDKKQVLQVKAIYQRMFSEIASDYPHKYDLLRNLAIELIHLALKMKPNTRAKYYEINASQRIASLFMELLERQFPIDDDHRQMRCRSASDFADQLNVHVNHLNRAVKETVGKTTTDVISERLLQEAKILLKHSSWNIAEIAYSLNFKEPTHFSNFFKKHMRVSPTQFRIH